MHRKPFPICTCVATLVLAPGSVLANPELRLHQELLAPDGGAPAAAAPDTDLSIRLEARFDCGEPAAVPALFVSVADTAVAAAGVESPQAVLLTIPHEQLRGFWEALACPGTGRQLLRGQLTAYATLTCSTPDGQQRGATVSRPLDLWVDCGTGREPARTAPGDFGD